jgi:hypothetical protein
LWCSFRTGRLHVHGGCLEGGKEITGDDHLRGGGGVYGVRRCGRHCSLRSWGGLIGSVPLSPPNFFEAIFLGGNGLRCFRLACLGTRLEHRL